MASGVRTGLFFGATSGAITTIGLMVGLNAGTQSAIAVVGGVLVIAIADAMSDALGIHLAQESDQNVASNQVWTATFSTFLTKFLTTLSFVVPVLLLPLEQAIVVSVVWGYIIIGVLSFFMARSRKTRLLPVLGEHLLIVTIVVVAANWIGMWVKTSYS